MLAKTKTIHKYKIPPYSKSKLRNLRKLDNEVNRKYPPKYIGPKLQRIRNLSGICSSFKADLHKFNFRKPVYYIKLMRQQWKLGVSVTNMVPCDIVLLLDFLLTV